MREIKEEIIYCAGEVKECVICDVPIDSCELCEDCAKGHDAFFSSKYNDAEIYR